MFAAIAQVGISGQVGRSPSSVPATTLSVAHNVTKLP